MTSAQKKALQTIATGSTHGVRLATALALETAGYVVTRGSMHTVSTRGRFGRGNWTTREVYEWTATITDAGKAAL
jgi:hypothetical protein